FDVLDGFTFGPASCELPDAPLLGFTLRSFSLSLGPDSLSRSRREPVALQTRRSGGADARLPFPDAQADDKIAVRRIRFGFLALLPLRIRKSPAVFYVALVPLLP